MKYHIIPTVFAHTAEEFKPRFSTLQPLFLELQIDFMDGKLVPVKGIKLEDVPDLTKLPNTFEAHLMVANPAQWLEGVKSKGFKRMIFHYEAIGELDHVRQLINKIKEADLEPILISNPSTPLEKVLPFLDELKTVMFMGHEPGYEKIPFEESVYEKIRKVRALKSRLAIQIDGGVNLQTIGRATAAGATHFNIGSFVFNSTDPLDAVNQLREAMR